MSPTTVRYVQAHDAERIIEDAAAPQLPITAAAIAPAIVERVPVDSGAARREYRTSVSAGVGGGGSPQARVLIGSPRWHFLEYGTQFNPPYRPIQTAVEGLGLRYEPK